MSYIKTDPKEKKHANDPNISDRKGSISERLRLLANRGKTREVAQKWGVSTSTLDRYINQGSMPSIDRAITIAEAEHVSLQWLATGCGEDEEVESVSGEHEAFPNVRVSYIEKVNVAASAGGGSYIEEESIEEYYPFSDEYLKRNRLSHAELLIIEAKGDSMAPYIESGDDLLLKRVEFNADNVLSGVHVISIDGMLKVKRLQYSLQKNGYRIISDNPEYSEEFIGHDEIMQGRMRVIGEVVMVMGRPSQPASQPAKD
ncbi:S24 family peptidase [Vibrio parahaemolyticus]|uniref:XRE family transcriptional regulator n=1 Tax=Vibrio parahaemolyticus TaxID=670 RepID=UPI002F3FF3CD